MPWRLLAHMLELIEYGGDFNKFVTTKKLQTKHCLTPAPATRQSERSGR